MLRIKTQKGITLISLVITIIILLILAAVAINLAIDSNGLFAKSGEASNKWNSSVATEGEMLENLMLKANELNGGTVEGEENPIPVKVEGVSLNKTTLSLEIGSTEKLTATITPGNATNQGVTWSSDNTTVTTVTDGIVDAVSAGTATITVTTVDGGKTASCTVNVMEKDATPPTGMDITVSSDSITVKAIGGSEFIGYQYSLDGEKWTETIESNVTHTFRELLAAKDYTVYARAINKAGKPSTNYTETVKTSSILVESVGINNANVSMNVGEKVTLTATITPGNATNQGVTWSSNNTAVATVTNGVVDAVGAGTATITVTTVDGSKTASCTVNVTKMISFTIDGTTYKAKEGITFRSMDL